MWGREGTRPRQHSCATDHAGRSRSWPGWCVACRHGRGRGRRGASRMPVPVADDRSGGEYCWQQYPGHEPPQGPPGKPQRSSSRPHRAWDTYADRPSRSRPTPLWLGIPGNYWYQGIADPDSRRPDRAGARRNAGPTPHDPAHSMPANRKPMGSALSRIVQGVGHACRMPPPGQSAHPGQPGGAGSRPPESAGNTQAPNRAGQPASSNERPNSVRGSTRSIRSLCG